MQNTRVFWMVLCLMLGLATRLYAAETTYFYALYEVGDFTAWTEDGKGAVNGGTNTVQTSVKLDGSYASKHEITNPSVGNNSANMTRWTFNSGPGTGPNGGMLYGYFSTWLYFDAGWETDDYWSNLMEIKTRNGAYSAPILYIQPVTRNNVFQYEIWHWAAKTGGTHPDVNCVTMSGYGSTCGFYQQSSPVEIPRQQWTQLEMYFDAKKTNGVIQVWQDGELIFDLTDADFNTIDSNSVGENNSSRNCADSGHLTPCYQDLILQLGVYVDPNSDETYRLYTDNVLVTSDCQSCVE